MVTGLNGVARRRRIMYNNIIFILLYCLFNFIHWKNHNALSDYQNVVNHVRNSRQLRTRRVLLKILYLYSNIDITIYYFR